MKLWIARKHTNLHVNLIFETGILRKHRHTAHFQSWDRSKSGCFGVVRVKPGCKLSVVVHELVHVALHSVEFFTDRNKVTRLSEYRQYMYYHEASASTVENMFKQYLKELERHER